MTATPGGLARHEARDAAELARDAAAHEFEPHERQLWKCGFSEAGDGTFCGYLAEDHERARAAGWGEGGTAPSWPAARGRARCAPHGGTGQG